MISYNGIVLESHVIAFLSLIGIKFNEGTKDGSSIYEMKHIWVASSFQQLWTKMLKH